MPNLGEIRVNIRLSDTGKEQTADEMKQLVNALRRFRGQPELEDDGKIRLSFNSMQFMPNAINVGFFDGVPWDIGAQALNFCRYGIGMPPNSIDELHSYGFPNRIRSDCELTHFFEHCWYVLKPGGTCHFKGTDLLELMRRCIDRKDCDNDLHIVERQLFTGQDRSGLYFNQCCLTKSRIISRMRHAGFLKIEVHCDDTPGTAALPKEADQIWLRPFTREQMESCLNGNTCIMCGNKRTNKPYRPNELSIYCRKHFRKANFIYVEELNKRLGIRWSSVKPLEPVKVVSRLDSDLVGEAPIWRGAKSSLGHLAGTVNLLPGPSMVTPVALRDMVNAVRKFRRLPEIRRRDGFKLSFNTQTFIPGCINLGNQSSIWEWDVLAGQFDFAVDGLPLPPDSVDEFVTEGFVHRLAAKQFEGFATSVYACLKPNAVFKGSFNLLDEAKRRMLEASQMADPQFAEQCLVTEMLSVASFKATVEHLGFAVNLLERGGKYNSVEDINLPEMNPALQGGALCCMVGCPSARFKPQTSDVPSKYCRRHYTTAARILWHDIAQRAIVMFSVSKRFRFRKGRRVRL